MRSDEELVEFFLDGNEEKKDELLKILGEILFENAPIDGCSLDDVDLNIEYHNSKIVYYDQVK